MYMWVSPLSHPLWRHDWGPNMRGSHSHMVTLAVVPSEWLAKQPVMLLGSRAL